MGKPLAIVAGAGAGAGPGLGQTLVSAFGLNRTIPSGTNQILHVDLADAKHTKAKLRNIICTHGAPKLVVQNTGKLVIAPFEETSIEDFEATWRAMVLSTVNLAHRVLPAMVDTKASRDLHKMNPARMMKPVDIAQTYLALANQPQSTWTHELDLRPKGGAF